MFQPDAFFSADQHRRMADLMRRWREARDSGRSLAADEQAEFNDLVEAELAGATRRAAALSEQTTSPANQSGSSSPS
jgi:hypothetical protein